MKSLAVFGGTFVFVMFALVMLWGESVDRRELFLIPLVIATFAATFTWKPRS